MIARAKLTTGDLGQVTGYSEKQLRNLCEAGVLVPEQGGSGTGCFRMFSTMQATSLAFAAQWSAMGYSRELVGKILDALSDYSERKLLAEFAKGRTHLIPRVDGKMKLTRWQADEPGDLFNVKAVYEQVQTKIEQILRENADAVEVRDGRGRRRGLVRT